MSDLAADRCAHRGDRAPDPLIPEPIWQRILGFVREGKTGQIVLHVVRGEIRGCDCNDMLRVEAKPR